MTTPTSSVWFHCIAQFWLNSKRLVNCTIWHIDWLVLMQTQLSLGLQLARITFWSTSTMWLGSISKRPIVLISILQPDGLLLVTPSLLSMKLIKPWMLIEQLIDSSQGVIKHLYTSVWSISNLIISRLLCYLSKNQCESMTQTHWSSTRWVSSFTSSKNIPRLKST